MRVLLAHNSYRERGGEDTVFEAESSMLRRHGHQVQELRESNERVDETNIFRAAGKMVWSSESHKRMATLLGQGNPEIVHFHNIFFFISPSTYRTCAESGLPVVQTLHNYRLTCPAAILFRNGKLCEDCVGRTIPWPAVAYGCWRGSRAGSAAVSVMLSVHNLLHTWTNYVDLYVAVSEFVKRKFIDIGIAPEQIVHKPNFIHPDPGVGYQKDNYALWVGRLSAEKGIKTLLSAWALLGRIPLKIIGKGPLFGEVTRSCKEGRLATVELLGSRPHDEVMAYMRNAKILIFPSEWYETFGMTIAEAFACGVPVIASRLGAMEEIVTDGYTGLHFTPGDADDLAAKVEWAWTHEKEMAEMGKNARREYEEKYTAERNYRMLMDIYQLAIERARKRYGSRRRK